MAFQLPELPYAYEALQPYMSAETLQYHHDKHHLAYVENGNKLLQGSGLEDKNLIDIVKISYGRNQGALQQCSPALQSPAFLEMDEEGRRRQQASRQA